MPRAPGADLLVRRVRRVAARVADGGRVDPGARQNIRSAPQKQPIPKIACSVPSGNGGPIGVPRTRCFPGTTIGVVATRERVLGGRHGGGLAREQHERRVAASLVSDARPSGWPRATATGILDERASSGSKGGRPRTTSHPRAATHSSGRSPACSRRRRWARTRCPPCPGGAERRRHGRGRGTHVPGVVVRRRPRPCVVRRSTALNARAGTGRSPPRCRETASRWEHCRLTSDGSDSRCYARAARRPATGRRSTSWRCKACSSE